MYMNSAIFNNNIVIGFDVSPIFSYVVCQFGGKIINSIKITNKSDEDYENIVFRIKMEREFVKFKEIYISYLRKGETIELTNFESLNNLESLRKLNEKEIANLSFEVLDQDGNVLGYSYKNIDIFPISTWPGELLPTENLACYVTPNDDYIKNLVYKARKEIKKLRDDDNFLGYQNNDINEVIKEIEAVYYSSYRLDLQYMNPPSSFERFGQKIRMAKEIYKYRQATCLDSTLFLASALEYVGLNTLVILYSGHAFLGVWLSNESFPSTLNDNQSVIYNYSDKNISRILLLETTLLTSKADFVTAVEEGRKNLEIERDDFVALDIHACRINGYKPIPTNKVDLENEDNKEIDPATISMPDIDLDSLNSEVEKETVTKDKFYFWKKKLLDLSLQNKLINMKIGPNNVQLLINDVYKFSDKLFYYDEQYLLVDNGNLSSFTSSKKEVIPCDSSLMKEISEDNFFQKRIEVFLTNKEFATSIPSLYRKSKNDMDESGTNTLYIALGLLEWKPNPSAKKANYAPLILYPVEIIKKSNKTFYLQRRSQEPILNTTLLVYLKEEFNIDIDFLSELPTKSKTDDSIDVVKVFNTIKKHINGLLGFYVKEVAFLGRFSFAKFIVWNEIVNRKEELLKHPIVRSYVDGKKEFVSAVNRNESSHLDDKINIKDIAIPLSSDSSQIEAIMDASLGESFVLIGPPGTGKSQTIANMIVNSLYNGKKVLFCSEKKAALDVVYSRLKTLRVDPFCLELHSNKQDKREVLKSLERVLDFGEVQNSEDFEKVTNNYNLVNEELQEIVQKIHFEKNYPISLYDALIRYQKYQDAKGTLRIEDNLIDEFNENRYKEISLAFKRAKSFSEKFETFSNNPFRIYFNRDYSKSTKDNLRPILENTIKRINTFNTLSKKLNKSLKIDSFSEFTLENVYGLFDYIDNHRVYLDLLSNEGSSENLNKLLTMVRHEKDVMERSKKIFKVFNQLVLNSNLDNFVFRYKQNESFNFLKKRINNRKLLKEVKSYAYNPREVNKNTIEKYLNSLVELKKDLQSVKKNALIIKANIPEDYKEENNDYDKILASLNYTIEVNKRLIEISKENLKPFIIGRYLKEIKAENASKYMIDEYKDNYIKLNENLNILIRDFKFDFSNINKSDYLNSLIDAISNLLKNIDLMNEWSNLLLVFDELNSFHLNDVFVQYCNGQNDFDYLWVLFNKELYSKIINKLIKDNELTKFVGVNYDNLIEEFNELDLQYKEEVVKEVVSKLSKNIPTSYSQDLNTSELGILKKAIKSNARGMSLRALLNAIPSIINRLTPCFLVSPLSCVKYLDPEFYNFDIVIFDEASQLPTSDAVCVISRGNSVVVAGDDKQLPPTSFFDRQINEEDEDLTLQDLESILDDSIAISFPVKKLLFHYRSKDESLIAFSNNKFYENSLFTFPSPNEINSRVKFMKVNGIYDSGKSATNEEEAKTLVKYLIDRIMNNPFNRSFGIITFSVRQMELIQKLLDDATDNNAELYDKIKTLKEEIFIKNLENVQGDERDVILLSVCYGRNKNGRFLHNFGPINNVGGYRRLNVAVTRSREEMVIFSSINYSDIDLSKTNSEGVYYLKSFLEFAEYGYKALATNQKSELLYKEGIENYIADDLKARGYNVTLHLGSSKYKIDIAVFDPNNNDRYVLGIIIDSYSYSNALSNKDRNIIQFDILKELGWKTMMVWSLDYYDSPKKVIDNIEEKIKESLLEIKDKPTNPIKDEPAFEDIEFIKIKKEKENRSKPYLKYAVKKPYSEKQLLEPRNRENIFNIMKQIIDIEAPISKSFLIKRIYEIFQISRKNKDNTQVIEFLISKLNNNIIYSYGLPFFFKDELAVGEIKTYRKANGRKIEEISKEEILVPIVDTLRNEISISEDSLKKEVATLLGFKVKTKKIDQVIEEAINYGMTKKNLFRKKNNGYIEIM